MTDHPIMFSAPMILALLAGRKTMTRRIIKPQCGRYLGIVERPRGPRWWFAAGSDDKSSTEIPVRFKPGDRLWVREAWRTNAMWDDRSPLALVEESRIFGRVSLYFCDGPSEGSADIESAGRVRASMHLPRALSRLTLFVESIKVEQLQDIGHEDARAEGLEYRDGMWGIWDPEGRLRCGGSSDPSEAFRCLWTNINGNGSWEADPWVCATSFRIIKVNIDSLDKAA